MSAQDPSEVTVTQLSGCYRIKVLAWELRDWEHRRIELPSLPATVRLRTRPLWPPGISSRSQVHFSSNPTVRRQAIARDYAGGPVAGFDAWWANRSGAFNVGGIGGLPGVLLLASLDDERDLKATAIYIPLEYQISLGRPTADFPVAVLDFARTPCVTAAPPPIPALPAIRRP